MFGFDGEYRRRPIQSLGGASQTCDRETVIKKAQQERQRRNEMRVRNNSAIVLQSYTRSFICRQRQKNNERRNFDEFMHTHRDDIFGDEALAYLVPRLIFFYNLVEAKDAERLDRDKEEQLPLKEVSVEEILALQRREQEQRQEKHRLISKALKERGLAMNSDILNDDL